MNGQDTSRGAQGRSAVEFWILQISGWALLLYLIYAQCMPAFNYDLGVRMGTQEPASQVTEVGVAFWWGFAFGDLVTYVPLLFAGLIGHIAGWPRARMALAAAFGITFYWPAVSLATVHAAHGLEGWTLQDESLYWIVLPLISLWGLVCLWLLAREG
jgi:hypothetical protein